MYYDLEFFGSYIRNKRKTMGYTQQDVARLTFLSTDTLRKIENGKVLPNHVTLEELSLVLKEDLNLCMLNFRLKEHSKFFQIKEDIERKIANGFYSDLISDNIKLVEILNALNPNSYAYKQIKQLNLLIESIIIKTSNSNYKKSLDKLVEALRLTTPDFSEEKYMDFYYSDFEVRILMNLALLEYRLGDIDLCQEILTFSLNHANSENVDLKLRLIFNLSYTFHRKGLNKKALYYADKGIDLSIENNNLFILGLLYTRKGIAEFNLNYKKHIDSLKTAYTLHKISKQDDLCNNLLKICQRKGICLD